MKLLRLLLLVLLAGPLAVAQQETIPPPPDSSSRDAAPAKDAEPPAAQEAAPGAIVLPAGTKVPLVLKHSVSTKSARVGDNLYLETTFPVVQNNRMVIPAGT